MTPLQITCAINVIAGDGLWVKPTLFLRGTAPDGSVAVPVTEPKKRRILSKETARLVRRAMTRVVDEGTGRRARIKGYAIGGKTGTKSKRKKDGTYDVKRSVTSFVCFAPSDRPRFTLLVSLDEPSKGAPPHKLTGGFCAAPTARRMLVRLFEALGVEKKDADENPRGRNG
jgi:cell division protein FtsI/penicillin-binding protein 2